MSLRRAMRATWLGRTGYLDGWRLQEAVASRVRAGGPDRLLLVEHDPVYTIGRRGSTANLLAGDAELRDAGAAVYRVDRGGDITFHGPGQVVGYPIVSLGPAPDLIAYVRGIEDALIDVAHAYGIAARTERGRTGVWADLPDGRPAKLAAIGVRVSRGVSTHGFALNVSTDLAAFRRMIPCGFAHEVASFARLGVGGDVADVARASARAIADRLGLALEWDPIVEAPRPDEIPDGSPVLAARDLLEEGVAELAGG